jgi:hypothetical protein
VHNSLIQHAMQRSLRLLWQTVFTFKYVFASLELPIYGGTVYNDKFQLLVNNVNYAFLSDGKAVRHMNYELL